MKTKTIIIDEKQVVVSKLTLRKFAQLLSTLQNIPDILSQISGKSNTEILSMLPQLVDKFYPDAVSILHASTDISTEDIDTWGIGDIIAAAEAIYEVNGLDVLFKRAKKYAAQQQSQSSANSITSNGSTPVSI